MNDSKATHSDTAYRLLPGEQLVSIVTHDPPVYPRQPSSVEQILRLTRVSQVEEVGDGGPSIASLSMSRDESKVPEYLRLYEVVFGRDSLRVAFELIETYPKLARSTLLRLAELQGIENHAPREEEPGRIVHEARDTNDPIAVKLTKELGWEWPYYGSVDATPEFIRTLAAYIRHHHNGTEPALALTYIDRRGTTRTLQYAFEAALSWIAYRRSLNTEGLVEFHASIPQGIENQAWKDSWDSYHHSDGTLASHRQGIASIEVQVSSYEALLDAAEIYDHIHETVHADKLRDEAMEFGKTIIRLFWTDDKDGYFVLGTDRDMNGALRQLKIRTSNMGHVLNSRLLEGNAPDIRHMREHTIQQLLSPEMLCVGGIRTLASDEIRFRSGAYHNGSVWLWDTHYIAHGLRRHGYSTEADELDTRILTAVNETGMFPEYIKGEQDRIALNTRTIMLWDETNRRLNTIEQPPQEVQAWTVAAIRNIKHIIAERERSKQRP